MFSNIGLSAGEVSFASLFASFFAGDRGNFILTFLSLLLTIIFWGLSLFIARRFQI
jgi:hypothetical protein